MRNIANIFLLVIVAFLCAFTPAVADESAEKSANEDQVKVLFLYNFIKYIEWPGAQALGQTHAANVCILGENPFGNALDILRQASNSQLAINVKLGVEDNQIPSCHILFIPRSQEGRVNSILATVHSHPVLTVSEISGFADNGGVMEMVKTEQTIGLFTKNKINLRINVKVADTIGLRIDAQLLGIASELIK